MAEHNPISETAQSFVFANNRDARLVCGPCDENLALLEQHLHIDIHMRGNILRLTGNKNRLCQAQKILNRLYDLVKAGGEPGSAETKGALAIIGAAAMPAAAVDTHSSAENMPKSENAAKESAQKDSAEHHSRTVSAPQSAPAYRHENGKQTEGKTMQGKSAAAKAPHSPAAANTEKKAQTAAFAHIVTRKKVIHARTPKQNAYIAAMQKAQLTFGIGPAGTGKTYLAVAYAAALLENGSVERIILSRPAVEAGERLGFLPGDMKDKVDPYLRPLYDALYDMLPAEKVERALAGGILEIAPLAFMRGRTLAHSAIILDEAQNTTPMQMKMLLTRLGEGSHMVINGDPSQIDLPAGQQSGLIEAVNLLQNIEHIALVRFSDQDVVRHPLVAAIIRAYAQKSLKTPEKLPQDGEKAHKQIL